MLHRHGLRAVLSHEQGLMILFLHLFSHLLFPHLVALNSLLFADVKLADCSVTQLVL